MTFLSTLLLSMFITIVLIPLLRSLAAKVNLLDIPDSRKIHTLPTPRVGGLAMALGALAPVVLWMPTNVMVRAVVMGAAILVIFGVIDDWKNIDYRFKFIGQIGAALLVILYGGIKITSLGLLLPEGILLPDWLAVPLTLIVIVGVTNAINLADGLDGLAGGISLLSFICIAYLAFRSEQVILAMLAVAVIGAIFGFLRYNTYPAVVFMGDAGSQFLGFSAAALSVHLTQTNVPLSPLLPLLLIGFPILDTLAVMYERIAEGRSPFSPDKKHFHHKLIRLGFSHTESVLVIYFLQACLVASAFIFRYYSDWLLLALYLVFAGLVLAGFTWADKSAWKLKRFDLIDVAIKGRLKSLRDKQIIIKVSFRVIEYGLPALLLFTSLVPAEIPTYLPLVSMSLVGLLLVSWLFKKDYLQGVLRLSLYLIIPFVVYQAESNLSLWISETFQKFYSLAFGLLVFFVFLTLRFSRREGFKSTPMDFLILLIALVVPNLPDETIKSYGMGLLAAKIIVLFFSYEVLIGELRGRLNRVVLTTMIVLSMVSIKGLLI